MSIPEPDGIIFRVPADTGACWLHVPGFVVLGMDVCVHVPSQSLTVQEPPPPPSLLEEQPAPGRNDNKAHSTSHISFHCIAPSAQRPRHVTGGDDYANRQMVASPSRPLFADAVEHEDRQLAEQIGKRVRTERERRKWSQAHLAELLGASANYVGYIERGERMVSLPTLAKMARVLSLPCGALLDGTSARDADWSAAALAILADLPPSMGPLVLGMLRGLREATLASTR